MGIYFVCAKLKFMVNFPLKTIERLVFYDRSIQKVEELKIVFDLGDLQPTLMASIE